MSAPEFDFHFEFVVQPSHPSLPGHFAGNPIVPGVVVLDSAIDALDRAMGLRVSRLHRVKFASALRPGETAVGRWEGRAGRASFRITTQRDGVSTKVAEGSCAVAGERAP
ncbi:MAG TPA: hypothetical protein VIE63_08650 [Ramlibacter sp.]|jgi:3-hydroxymyristoyl/3-hydroxydecanoyl-(acyl carrier protein) dehydratase